MTKPMFLNPPSKTRDDIGPMGTTMDEAHGFPTEEDFSALSFSDEQLAADVLWAKLDAEHGTEPVAFFLKVYGPTKCRAAGRPLRGAYRTFPWTVNPTRNVDFDEFACLTASEAYLSDAAETFEVDESLDSLGYRVCKGSRLTYFRGRVDEDPTPWW